MLKGASLSELHRWAQIEGSHWRQAVTAASSKRCVCGIYWYYCTSPLPRFLCCLCASFCHWEVGPWKRDERWRKRKARSHHTSFCCCCMSQEVSADEQACASAWDIVSSCRPSSHPPTVPIMSISGSWSPLTWLMEGQEIRQSLLTFAPAIRNLRVSTHTVSLLCRLSVVLEWRVSVQLAPLSNSWKEHLETP